MLTKILKKRSGFTLIETGIVIMIAGISMVAGAQFVKLYTENIKHSRTISNLEMSQSAIGEFLGLNGHYPCPANPSLPPSDPNYGISQCRNPLDASFDEDTCIGTPAGIKCTTHDSRDGDNNGNPDVVMIGVLPFKTLQNGIVTTPFTASNRTDGYGTLLGYAVTEHMTNTNVANNLLSPVNPLTGGIKVVDENRINITKPAGMVHYVLYSHGLDAVGGYSTDGNLIESCSVPSLVAPIGSPVPPTPGLYGGVGRIQTENCDNNDAFFLQAPLSLGNNNSYNDDILYFKAKGLTSLWKRSLASPTGQSYIYSTNVGNVGVETPTPTSKLHIMGSLSAQTSLIAPEFCNSNDTACLNPTFLGGTADGPCSDTELAYAVGENKIECRPVDWTVPNKTCQPIGGDLSFVQGFSNLGNLYCCTKTGVCEKQCGGPCP